MRRTSFPLLVHSIEGYMDKRIRIPEIQRENTVWSIEQKQNLIDSLYNDFDIPKLYLREDTIEHNIWWLIDGQQRLQAIIDFINNKFALTETSTIPKHLHNKKFKQLNPDEQENILGRTLDFIKVICSDDEEEDMFIRLNNGTPLSAAEKRNAIKGEFRATIKKLAKHKFFKNKINFSSRRFAVDAVCAQIVALTLAEGPTDTKGKSLKSLYQDKKVFSEKKIITKTIKSILDLTDKIFSHEEPFMKKYNVISISFFLNELRNNYTISGIKPTDYYKFFIEFETSRQRNSQITEDDLNFDFDLSKYQMACVNSPDSESCIRDRHEILMKKFFTKFTNIEFKDSTRIFSTAQKEAIYLILGRKCVGVKNFICQNKNKILPITEFEFDHIKEHNEGGKTTVKNGQLLCKKCHSIKTRKYNSAV